MKDRVQKAFATLSPQPYFYPVVTGMLLALAMANYSLGFLVFVALVPLVQYFYQSRNDTKLLLRGALWGGLVCYGYSFSWVVYAQMPWANITPFYKQLILIVVWLVAVLLLSSIFMLVAAGVRLLRPFRSLAALLILLPALWVIGEYIGRWIFAIGEWGPQATLSADFAYGHIGMAVATTPLGYLSRFIGLYGLAFVAVLVNAALWYSLRRRVVLPAAVTAAVVSVLAVASYYASQPQLLAPITVATMQIPAASSGGPSGFSDRLAASPPPDGTSVDTLVLPEYAPLFSYGSDKDQQAALQELFLGQEGLIIYSTSVAADSGIVNKLVLASPGGNTLHSHDKTYLIPTGEYIPSIYRFAIGVLGLGQYLADYDENSYNYRLQKGDDAAEPYVYRGVSYGALPCSAAIIPALYQPLSRAGANVLTNSSSIGFAAAGSTMHDIIKESHRFAAIANAKPLVVATRGGEAYVLDHNGAFLVESNGATNRLFYANVTPAEGKTLYARVGEIMVPLSVLLIAGLLIRERFAATGSRPSAKLSKN